MPNYFVSSNARVQSRASAKLCGLYCQELNSLYVASINGGCTVAPVIRLQEAEDAGWGPSRCKGEIIERRPSARSLAWSACRAAPCGERITPRAAAPLRSPPTAERRRARTLRWSWSGSKPIQIASTPWCWSYPAPGPRSSTRRRAGPPSSSPACRPAGPGGPRPPAASPRRPGRRRRATCTRPCGPRRRGPPRSACRRPAPPPGRGILAQGLRTPRRCTAPRPRRPSRRLTARECRAGRSRGRRCARGAASPGGAWR
mmetsp:Transcript_10642/g.21969  ORF Transcript_10642/g.21969 Transcript_10642/m.21969 type:complete len:258 (+) Transcript_10642:92-865(+)